MAPTFPRQELHLHRFRQLPRSDTDHDPMERGSPVPAVARAPPHPAEHPLENPAQPPRTGRSGPRIPDTVWPDTAALRPCESFFTFKAKISRERVLGRLVRQPREAPAIPRMRLRRGRRDHRHREQPSPRGDSKNSPMIHSSTRFLHQRENTSFLCGDHGFNPAQRSFPSNVRHSKGTSTSTASALEAGPAKDATWSAAAPSSPTPVPHRDRPTPAWTALRWTAVRSTEGVPAPPADHPGAPPTERSTADRRHAQHGSAQRSPAEPLP